LDASETADEDRVRKIIETGKKAYIDVNTRGLD